MNRDDIKPLVGPFLAAFKEYADGTPSPLDDVVHNILRDWALRNGLLDEGQDPGPRPQGGDGGGP